jgi:hypothetical protein
LYQANALRQRRNVFRDGSRLEVDLEPGDVYETLGIGRLSNLPPPPSILVGVRILDIKNPRQEQSIWAQHSIPLLAPAFMPQPLSQANLGATARWNQPLPDEFESPGMKREREEMESARRAGINSESDSHMEKRMAQYTEAMEAAETSTPSLSGLAIRNRQADRFDSWL